MANYAHVEDGQITGVYDLLPVNWKNVSNFQALADDPATLQALGWIEVKKIAPEYNEYTQRLGNPVHTVVDGEVIETIEIFDLPPVEQVQPIVITEQDIINGNIVRHNDAVAILRTERDRLLAASDFTQLPDVIESNGPELTQAFKEYRQALRDFPTQYINDPTFFDAGPIVFPEYPSPTPVVPEVTLPVESSAPEETPPVPEETPPVPEETPPTYATDAFGNPIDNSNTQPDSGTV